MAGGLSTIVNQGLDGHSGSVNSRKIRLASQFISEEIKNYLVERLLRRENPERIVDAKLAFKESTWLNAISERLERKGYLRRDDAVLLLDKLGDGIPLGLREGHFRKDGSAILIAKAILERLPELRVKVDILDKKSKVTVSKEYIQVMRVVNLGHLHKTIGPEKFAILSRAIIRVGKIISRKPDDGGILAISC